MTERFLFIGLAFVLALIAIGLLRTTAWLRRTGKSIYSELFASVFCLGIGLFILVSAPSSELRWPVALACFLILSGFTFGYELVVFSLIRTPWQLRCSFCGKSHRDVQRLVQAERANICDECVAICADVVKHVPAESSPPAS